MPANVWVVYVVATKENAKEEAMWLINIAASLMRLSGAPWPVPVPEIGETEQNPTHRPIHGNQYVTINDEAVWTLSGSRLAGYYELGEEQLARLATPEFKARASVLFDPPDRSLAQRVAQGLGWLSRGRQASDRAERFLAFFTAIEALLSSSDKSAPVVQTISRYLAVIWTSDVEARAVVFNQIKALYGLRSQIVHAGGREVLWQEVNRLQIYSEQLVQIVLTYCPLDMRHDQFVSSLSRASHGLPWEYAPVAKGTA